MTTNIYQITAMLSTGHKMIFTNRDRARAADTFGFWLHELELGGYQAYIELAMDGHVYQSRIVGIHDTRAASTAEQHHYHRAFHSSTN
jgi:hypothetical protein